MMIFTVAVEGPSDEVLLRKIVSTLGDEIGQVYGRNGKAQLLRSLTGYNVAAQFSPWIVLVDLDNEECAVTARAQWLPTASNLMCLRIAVRELEAWLMADRERFASFFSVSIDLLPVNPDELRDPKESLINIVRRSRRSAVRADIVPDQALGQSVGPAYTARLIEFLTSEEGWRAETAAANSDSLRRAIRSINECRDKSLQTPQSAE